MRFIHTSDWHLGRSLHSVGMIDAQAQFLDWLVDLVRAECGELPRAVNFISGPSRTGDIEQTLVLGAHGPYRVHIVLLAAE